VAIARRLLRIAFHPRRRRVFSRALRRHPSGGVYFAHAAWRTSSRSQAERMRFGAAAQLTFRSRGRRFALDLVRVVRVA